MEKYTSRGLEIAGMQSWIAISANGASEDEDERKVYAESLLAQLDFCKVLGAKVCGVWPGPAMPYISDGEIIARLINTFRKCIKKAKDENIVICMEPEPVQVDCKLSIAKAVIEGISSNNFKILYDSAHANVLSQGKPVETIKEFKGKIGHVHLSDNDRGRYDILGGTFSSKHMEIGKGNLDIKAILDALKDINYDGWIQIDVWESPNPLKCSEINKRVVDNILKGNYCL